MPYLSRSLAFALFLILVGCARSQENIFNDPPGPEPQCIRLNVIYFDFNSGVLSPSAQDILRGNAGALAEQKGANISVEGHTDERGTDEYNMALGQRRAQAAFDYLRSLGVSPERMEVVSWGKERPAWPNHNEIAWQRNRRAEFLVKHGSGYSLCLFALPSN